MANVAGSDAKIGGKIQTDRRHSHPPGTSFANTSAFSVSCPALTQYEWSVLRQRSVQEPADMILAR
jgi:hypothetical protein